MSFQNLDGFWLLFLLPIIILLYLLKLRREERRVSSNFLWSQFVRDFQANAPWQRLQSNILMFLQLLIMALFILAIARPTSESYGIHSKDVIIIIDTSASMAATDVRPDRLGYAKVAAADFVDSLSNDSRVTIITAGDKPRTVIASSSDRRTIHQALNQIQIESQEGGIAPALQIAAAISQRNSDTQTIILSDGNAKLPDRISYPDKYRFIQIGELAENQSIQVLTIQKDPIDGDLTAFAQVVNDGSSEAKSRISFFADGALVSVSDLSIPPGAEQSAIASGIISNTTVVEAHLAPLDGTQDYLSLDNQAFRVNRQGESIQVALVSEGNLFLETALALIPWINLGIYKPSEIVNEGVSLTIYDRVVPKSEQLPETNLFFIAPPESTEFFTVTGKIDLPIARTVEPVDPVLKYVDISGISILDASEIVGESWQKVLIEDFSTTAEQHRPLLMIGENENRRMAVLSFNPARSDLPLQVAFPILISNLTEWLIPQKAGLIPDSVPLGAPIDLSNLEQVAENEANAITVVSPDGRRTVFETRDGNLLYKDTIHPGIYTILDGNSNKINFAVNFSSPQESKIRPGEMLSSPESPSNTDSASAQAIQKDWWRLIAWIALIVLWIEWLVSHRASVLELLSATPFSRIRIPFRSK